MDGGSARRRCELCLRTSWRQKTPVHEDGGDDHDAPLVYFVRCDTSFNSSWSWCTRRSKVMRIGDRHDARQIRVIQADENPIVW